MLHDAELRIDLGSADGKARWYAIVPHDDGTLSAAVTAMRLTGGATEPPAGDRDEIIVERLGPTGAPVSARIGDMLIFGGTREELLRGLRRIGAVVQPGAGNAVDRQSRDASAIPNLANRVDSGLFFDLHPERMNTTAGTTTNRRAAAFLQGLGCRRMSGNLALKDDRLALEVTTFLGQTEPSRSLPAAKPVAVDPSWLTWIPARDVMAVVSLAFEPGAAFWNSAFALADRVDRADPSRAQVAALRTRINLLTTAAGARPEVDLWPHLRGVTASLMGDPNQPGRPAGGLVVLHTDGAAGAKRIAIDVIPRLSALWTGKKPDGEPIRQLPPGPNGRRSTGGRRAPAGVSWRSFASGFLARPRCGDRVERRRLERVEGGGGTARSVGRRSLYRLDERRKYGPPNVWARLAGRAAGLPIRGLDTTSLAWKALAQDPPAVWWGWTGSGEARDLVQYSGLRNRVRQFLDQIPLDRSPLR